MVESSEELIQRYGNNAVIPIEIWQKYKELPKPDDNFIFKLARFMNEKTKVKYDWCELCAMVTLATVCGHTTLYSYNKYKLNIMIFCLGPSGSGKNAVSKMVKYFLNYLEYEKQDEIKAFNNSIVYLLEPEKEEVVRTPEQQASMDRLNALFASLRSPGPVDNHEVHENVQESTPSKKSKKKSEDDEEEKKRVVVIRKSFLGPKTFSRQGYTKMAAATDENNNHINTEFCVIIQEYSSQTQEMSMDHKKADNQFICDLYDGEGVDDAIGGERGHIKVDNIYWNMLLSSTDAIFKSLKFSFLIDGTGNRCAFAVIGKDAADERIENESKETLFRNDDIDDIIANSSGKLIEFNEEDKNELGDYLLDIYKNAPKALKFSDGAQEKFLMYKKSRHKDAQKKLEAKIISEVDAYYIDRQYFTLMKYAGLFCIARNYQYLPGRDGILIIEEEDMDNAIARLESNFDGFFEFEKAWVDAPEDERDFSNKPFIKNVIKAFDNAPHGIRCANEIAGIIHKDNDTRIWSRLNALTTVAPPILDFVTTSELEAIKASDPDFNVKHGLVGFGRAANFFKLHKKQLD